MKRRSLGGLEVGAIGLGCMSMTPIYGEPSEPEAIATIHRAAELGVDLIDTSDAYAIGKNEELVGRAIKGRRDKIVLATKFGQIRRPDGGGDVNGKPDYVRAACEASLTRLGVTCIDLYYIHRIDPTVPIEETVGAMARLKDEGKIRYLGISECSPATLRRAHKTHPMAALQTEYSLWTRDAEADLLDTCAELGIGYVAYAPLGPRLPDRHGERGDARARRTGGASIRASSRTIWRRTRACCRPSRRLPPRKAAPRRSSRSHGSWRRRPFIVPLPGTKQRRWLEENAKAAEFAPTQATLAALDRAFPPGATVRPALSRGAAQAAGDLR